MKLKPINRISPSRFSSLKKCRLKEVFRANKQENLLPVPPNAWLGRVIHSVLENAVKQNISNQKDLLVLWNETIKYVEDEISNHKISRHFIPLSNSANYFEVKKRQCINTVRKLTETEKAPQKVSHGGERGKVEHWLESKNGKVAGIVDRIFETDSGGVIIDYKTGSIFEENHNGAVIKDEYQAQLKLYAALYYEQFGCYPHKLQIIGLDGEKHEIHFSPEECCTLLQEAQDILVETNNTILTEPNTDLLKDKLASPSPKACGYCSFRPICPAYLRILGHRNSQDQWPADIKGMITDKRILGNRTYMIKIRDSQNRSITIRGLNPEKFDLLEEESLKEIMVFSLVPDKVENYYRESPMTVIYKSGD